MSPGCMAAHSVSCHEPHVMGILRLAPGAVAVVLFVALGGARRREWKKGRSR